jgi:hypothetical protein
LIGVTGDGAGGCCCCSLAFTCGAIADGAGDDVDDDSDLLVGLLTGAIVAPATLLVIGRELALELFVVAICCCCFLGAATLLSAVVVGFVIVVCCGGDDDDTADVSGVADDNEGGFYCFWNTAYMRFSGINRLQAWVTWIAHFSFEL